ncbi:MULTISPECIES: hypothetical protein [Metallosphaera]|nr:MULTISPECIES: hypothetical protein [Metallosphaera]BBL47198.1 hypothetical protein MJ1HA_1299 [Metallosphaera sedula]
MTESMEPKKTPTIEELLIADLEVTLHTPGWPKIKPGREMTLYDVLMLSSPKKRGNN